MVKKDIIFDYSCIEAVKNKGGRPPKWENVEEFKKAADGFFDWCKKYNLVPDIEGLGLYTNSNRTRLNEYEKKEEFRATIKQIKQDIAFYKKQMAYKGDIDKTVFIFDFKNNHGYKDKLEVETNKDINILIDE